MENTEKREGEKGGGTTHHPRNIGIMHLQPQRIIFLILSTLLALSVANSLHDPSQVVLGNEKYRFVFL